jgi:hypothetical protein
LYVRDAGMRESVSVTYVCNVCLSVCLSLHLSLLLAGLVRQTRLGAVIGFLGISGVISREEMGDGRDTAVDSRQKGDR